MKYFAFDFETRSHVDIKKTGTTNYARHPSTEILCMAYALLDRVEGKWTSTNIVLSDNPNVVTKLVKDAYNNGCMFIAHNVAFERAICKYKLGIDIPPERWVDTAAIARHYRLPGALALIGKFIGFEKDMTGNRIMKKLCKPRTSGKKQGEYYEKWEVPDDFKAMYDYCKRDVEVSVKILEIFGLLPPEERQYFELTLKMNWAGLEIDYDGIMRAQKLIATEKDALEKKLEQLTKEKGGEALRSTQNVKLAQLLKMDSVAKHKVRDALKADNDPLTQEILETKKILSQKSVQKLTVMQLTCDDNFRIYDSFIYAGASGCGRWSSVGVQLQNIPRGQGKTSMEWVLNCAYPPPFHMSIKDSIRSFIKGPFLCGDYSQVEARLLAIVAGQDDLVDRFANKGKVYEDMAAKIYKRRIEEILKDSLERQLGKQAILSAGYGSGAKKFRKTLDETYDIQIDLQLAYKVVDTYRRTNPKIVELWSRFENAFLSAMRGKAARVSGILFSPMPQGVKIRLLSGRVLYYFQCVYHNGDIWHYGKNQVTNKYEQVKTYGGRITQNIIAGIARDLMAFTMVNLDKAGFHVALTVHDEIGAQDPPELLKEFTEIFNRKPKWAATFPIACETFATPRYRK